MKQKTLMIFLSCAIGSGIGFLLAKEFGVLWILGILLGGLAGYIVYDFKQILSAIPVAFQYAIEKVGAWEIKSFLNQVSAGLYFIIFVVFIPGGVLWFGLTEGSFSFLVSFIYVFVLIGLNMLILLNKEDFEESLYEQRAGKMYKKLGTYSLIQKTSTSNVWFIGCLALSPLISVFFFFKLLKEGGTFIALWVSRKIWNFVKVVPFFFWKLFKLVHSSERLLVATDSMLGGMIGFLFLDSILLSMLAGAVLGVVNYEVVSVRILKLKPKV